MWKRFVFTIYALASVLNIFAQTEFDVQFDKALYTMHNFARMENVYGQNLMVHRKGAICAREGERPCPFCGTLVFSDETLMDPDLLEQKIEEMRQKIGSQNWKPLLEKDKVVSSAVTTIDTQMFDLQTDWFDSELQEIFRANLHVP